MKQRVSAIICSFLVCGANILVCPNAAAVIWGRCVTDNTKPIPIPCLTNEISWTDTAHCVFTGGSVECLDATQTVTHHDEQITWNDQEVDVGQVLVGSDEGDETEYGDPPVGPCVTFLGYGVDEHGNPFQKWEVWTPVEGTDNTSLVQGASCNELILPSE